MTQTDPLMTTFSSMTFVLVVIFKSFTLYCVEASFICGRAMDCTIFEKFVCGLFLCNALASR